MSKWEIFLFEDVIIRVSIEKSIGLIDSSIVMLPIDKMTQRNAMIAVDSDAVSVSPITDVMPLSGLLKRSGRGYCDSMEEASESVQIPSKVVREACTNLSDVVLKTKVIELERARKVHGKLRALAFETDQWRGFLHW